MRRNLLMALILILLMGVVGCGSLGLEDQIKSWQDAIKTPIDQPSDDVINDLIKEPVSQANLEKITIQLYFARQEGNLLAVEEREITKVPGIARATVEELLKGPREETLKRALPPQTRLLDINIKPDGTCIVDFSSHIQQVSGSKAEALAVYSVVNTLSQFSTVKSVIFLVEGNRVESVGGYISTAEPVTSDYGLSE